MTFCWSVPPPGLSFKKAKVFPKDRNWKEYQQGRWEKRANSAWEWGVVLKLISKTSSCIRLLKSSQIIGQIFPIATIMLLHEVFFCLYLSRDGWQIIFPQCNYGRFVDSGLLCSFSSCEKEWIENNKGGNNTLMRDALFLYKLRCSKCRYSSIWVDF